jgi:RNA polymerase sigma-70 factor, ECF subfamily
VIGRPAAAIEDGIGELGAQIADFFGEHYERLLRLGALVCHSPESVEDAVQAAMEKAWRKRHTLRDPALIRPWLDQIVVREAIRLNRRPWWARLRPAPEGVIDDVADLTAQTGVDPNWIAVVTAFRRLPAEQRAVVALHLYEGYSVDETARLTGSRLETTRSRLRLARQRLRRELGEDGP